MRAVLRRVLIALPLAAAVAAPAPARAQDLPQLGARLAAELEAFCARESLPGASLAVTLPDGRTLEAAAGHADLARRIPLEPRHRMLAASAGKTLVAAAALGLALEGRLGLDAPIARWLGREPWFARLVGGEAITTRMLLQHTSGVRNHVADPRFAADWREGRRQSPDFAPPPEQVVRYVLDQPPLFPPGTGFAYTDTGYIIAGLVIERAGGSSLYDQVERRFLRPLGLHGIVPSDRRALPDLAVGYAGPTEPFGLPAETADSIGFMRWNPAMEWAGGGFASTPADLARWAKALYEGRAMSGEYLEPLLARPPAAPVHSDSSWYGLGVSVRRTPLGPGYGHGGSIPGYRTQMTYYPRHRLAVALQSNGEPRAAGAFVTTAAQMVIDALAGGR